MGIFILTLTAPVQAFELYLNAYGEPFSAETFVKTADSWTYTQEYVSLGLEIGTHYDNQYFYLLGRLIPATKESENYKFAFIGGAFKAGIIVGDRFLNLEYSTHMYWDTSGDFGLGPLLYTTPAHRFTVNIRIPICR